MQNSDDNLISIKMTNFKIILTNLVESIEYLEDENDLDKSVQIGKELISQFGLITEKFSIYHDKLDNYENNIKNLNSILEENKAQIEENKAQIEEHKNKYNIEHENMNTLQICLNETTSNLEKNEKLITELECLYNKNIQTLENINKELCETIKEMQNKIDIKTAEIINLKDTINDERNKKEVENQSQKSLAYIEKLNEGNVKIIQKHSDKIKQLDIELIECKRKIVELENNNNELQKYNIELNSISDNFKIETLDLKDDNYKLQKEIEELRYYKDLNYNDINKPLLNKNIENNENKNNKDDLCNFCCIS